MAGTSGVFDPQQTQQLVCTFKNTTELMAPFEAKLASMKRKINFLIDDRKEEQAARAHVLPQAADTEEGLLELVAHANLVNP